MTDDDLNGAFFIAAISLVCWLFFFQLVDSDLSTPNRIFWAVVAGIYVAAGDFQGKLSTKTWLLILLGTGLLGAIAFATNGYMQIGERARFVSGTDNLLVATGLGIATAGSLGGLFCATTEFFLKFSATGAPNRSQMPSQPVKSIKQPARSTDDAKFGFDPSRFGKKAKKEEPNSALNESEAEMLAKAARTAHEVFRLDARQAAKIQAPDDPLELQMFIMALDEINKAGENSPSRSQTIAEILKPESEKYRSAIRQELAKLGAITLEPPSSKPWEQDMSQWSWLPATARTGFAQAPAPKERTSLDELEDMIGLEPVKEQIRRMHAKILLDQKRATSGAKATKQSMHMVFTGNPGTGKTTVARIVGRILKDLGILERPTVHEVTRTDLVAEYVGQTAPKTAGEIEKALGGVLFIDEAYSLAPADGRRDFGSEAIDTLLREMENHRDKLLVIVAGYETEMDRFIASNPGLQSRFKNTIHFPDYTASEMHRIFEKITEEDHFKLTEDARALLQHHLVVLEQSKGLHFGNGRDVRNLFEDCTSNLALRTVNLPSGVNSVFSTITAADIPKPKSLADADTALWNIVQSEKSSDDERSAALKKLKKASNASWPKGLSHSG